MSLALAFGPAPEAPDPILPRPSDTLTVTVHRVIDGDTVDVVMPGGAAQRVRLLDVDTPEVGSESEQLECYAAEATAALRNLLPPRSTAFLWLEEQPYDQYERLLAHVWAHDGRWVNGQLLLSGAGEVLVLPPNTALHSEAVQLEARARADFSGLWGSCA